MIGVISLGSIVFKSCVDLNLLQVATIKTTAMSSNNYRLNLLHAALVILMMN